MAVRVRKRRLFWQIYSSFLIVASILLLIVTWYVSTTMRSHNMKQATRNLKDNAALAGEMLYKLWAENDLETLKAECEIFKRDTNVRFTVISEDGKVIADSDYAVATMEDHGQRPEVKEAIAHSWGSSLRRSTTLNLDMLYVALRLNDGNGTLIIRAARPINQIEDAIWGLQSKIALAWLSAILISAGIFLRLSRSISKPFEDLKAQAQLLARGEINALPESNLDEAGGLSEVMSYMASRLTERTVTITQQREELEAILSSMSEALLAVDSEMRVLKLNSAMAAFFDIDQQSARGKRLPEVIRNTDFLRFIELALQSKDMVTLEMTIYQPDPHTLHGSGTRLRDNDGNVIGAVVVFNDVTRLQRLEDLRKDFVANVSHELRTPITSIKGFVETLQGGALEDKDAAEHFLKIVARQADRLGQIIEDLLSLSKIESSQGSIQLELQEMHLLDALEGALKHCEHQANVKKMKLKLTCDPDIKVEIHPSLFEQAVANLIDNAIKYSDPEKKIKISGTALEDGIYIDIQDKGFGIPRSHLDRLFERFYRVDKARSREVGGTGLGLSIVKHIASAHGGSVTVDSQVGSGSTFTIKLPYPKIESFPEPAETEAEEALVEA